MTKPDWPSRIEDERDQHGLLTPLASALCAIRDDGCDCGTDEPGTCVNCLCESALWSLWVAVQHWR